MVQDAERVAKTINAIQRYLLAYSTWFCVLVRRGTICGASRVGLREEPGS
jgi:hypothetical protein